jgi:far upstream element-binding protein
MTTAEEALARAKAIAARLSGGNGTSSSSPTAAPSTNRPKRNRWGVAPSIVTTAAVSNLDAERSSSLPGLAEAMDASSQKKQKTLARKRVWIKTSRDRPESHFYSYFHDRLPRITETMYQQAGNSEDAKDEVSKVSILLKGRGSSNVPPPPGQPEEPMHVLIIGPESLIDRVDPLVDDLMFEAERAPPENIGELSSDPNSALTVTPSQSLSSYRPATVAQLLNQNALALPGGNIIEEEILVPNGIVGYLIGRGGENITSMQARSNCKVQIQKEHDLKPGQTDRVITLVAATQESIDQCREIIESMVKVSYQFLAMDIWT